MTTDVFDVTLGFEDLLVMLRLLDIAPLPGLARNPEEGVPPEEMDAALAAAERSLRARGFIHLSDDGQEITLYSPLPAVLLSCATAHTVLRVLAETADRPQGERFFHIADELAVEHSFPENGLFGFTSAPQFQDIADRLLGFLQIEHQPRPTGGGGIVSDESIDRARELAAENEDEATALLKQGGLPRKTAQGLVEAWRRPVCLGAVVAAHGDEQITSEDLGIVQGSKGIWFMEAGQQEDQIKISAVTGDEAAERIMAMAPGTPTE